jgi:hypothetical protein
MRKLLINIYIFQLWWLVAELGDFRVGHYSYFDFELSLSFVNKAFIIVTHFFFFFFADVITLIIILQLHIWLVFFCSRYRSQADCNILVKGFFLAKPNFH